jgi:hypothetical protein
LNRHKPLLNEAKQKLDTLKDPLLREIVQAAQDERQAMVEELYQFAGLTMPEKQEETATTNSSSIERQTNTNRKYHHYQCWQNSYQ